MCAIVGYRHLRSSFAFIVWFGTLVVGAGRLLSFVVLHRFLDRFVLWGLLCRLCVT